MGIANEYRAEIVFHYGNLTLFFVFTEFYRVLLGFPRYNLVKLGFNGFNLVLAGLTGF